MLSFLMPLWLWGVPVVAAIGVWALWKGRHAVHRVSSAKLWQGLSGEAAGQKARKVDPVWLMVLIAAVLAMLLLAGPMWGRMEEGPRVSGRVVWAMRAAGEAGPAQLFVRAEEMRGVGEACTLTIDGKATEVRSRDLEAGQLLELPMAKEFTVELSAGKDVLAKAVFSRGEGRTFGLLSRIAPGGQKDAAVWRVFAIHPGAREGDPAVHPTVLIVDDPKFSAGQANEEDTLIVASPRTTLPGITAGATVELKPAGAPESRVIALERVRVERYVKAKLSSEWEVLARINGDPWVALRVDRDKPTRRWLWMASRPAVDTNWGVDVSFVVLLLRQLDALSPAAATRAASGETVEWIEHREELAVMPSAAAGTSLSPAVAVVVLALLAGASALLVMRSRAVRG